MQRDDVLLEVQSAVVVGVEGTKHVARVGLGVAVGEEAAVDLLKLFRCYPSRRALLLKVLVPQRDLSFSEFGAELEVLQDLLGYGAAGGISHGEELAGSQGLSVSSDKL